MLPFIFNLKLILPSLFFLNLLAVFLFKNEFRFLKGQIFIFAILILIFLGYRLFVFPAIHQNIQQAKNQEIKEHGWDYINMPEVDQEFQKQELENIKTNVALFKIVGFQAVFSFIFSLIGIFTTTKRKIYAAYALGFLIIAGLLFM